MGTCMSRCYPTSTAGSGSPSCSSPAAIPLPPAASCNAVAVHPLPLPFPLPSPSTSSSSSFKAMATSSSSSSFLNRDTESDSLLVEWDVVVLDPNNKKPPQMRPHHPGSRGPATSKRARPVSPLATRPAPPFHHKKKKTVVRSTEPHAEAQVRKKKKKTVVRSTEPHADAQARKKKVAALDLEQRRLHSVPPPPQARGSRGAQEDELTNPLISMDCFIFL